MLQAPDLRNQESERIINEIEQILTLVRETQGEWIPIDTVKNTVTNTLGYEDADSLEDALKNTFAEFIEMLPQIELKTDEQGRKVMKASSSAMPRERAFKLTLKITNRDQLQTLCLKSETATIEIPELEFSVGGDAHRSIDTIYNHLTKAIFNLEFHVSNVDTNMPAERKAAILDTTSKLSECLDVSSPWTWIIHDSSGRSTMKPMDGVIAT
eukprot:TRINITY_DN9619_c0_g1_i1.p1 TRINITY_DN9619_c0_g1~~TRINITY_DN9619_c0_g1_i1.p1  ORF type:complete len:212 (-),score=41.17 TRINITY_DN9619_c0_g1_i1:93-728(-)